MLPTQGLDGMGSSRVSSEDRDENFAEALSKSMEMSYLLRSRSPWISVDTHAATAICEQRERSLSYASMPANSIASFEEGSGTYSKRRYPTAKSQTDDGYVDSQFDTDVDHLLQPGGINSHRSFGSQRSYLAHFDKDLHLSTLSQSIFNATNLLMGVGLLSLPYTMRLCGWIGIPILLFFAAFTCYTGTLLGRMMDYTPAVKLREGPGAYTMYGFHDMGFVAFGEPGRLFISFIFILETFGYCCVYLIIEGENLHHLIGQYMALSPTPGSQWRREEFMCLAAGLFLPTVMLRNLNWLSYLSALGVLSSVMLLGGVVWTGLDPQHLPPSSTYCDPEVGCTGSILKPSPTLIERWQSLPVVMGLVLVGFAGHAVLPTIRNDMMHKKEYNKMVYVTYTIVTLAYVGMAAAGYMMFGAASQPEITLNLGANIVSQVTIWIVVVNPVTKFALDMSPIALGLERSLQLAFSLPETGLLTGAVSVLVRTILVALALTIVIAVPDFALVLGLLGSACSFTISVSFPCLCYLRIYWRDIGFLTKAVNCLGVLIGVAGAVIGTAASILYPEARI